MSTLPCIKLKIKAFWYVLNANLGSKNFYTIFACVHDGFIKQKFQPFYIMQELLVMDNFFVNFCFSPHILLIVVGHAYTIGLHAYLMEKQPRCHHASIKVVHLNLV
jgi:hypothetical protein